MYITLEKQYQFFKFLQEYDYNFEKILPEYGQLFILAGYKMPKNIDKNTIQFLVNSQIELFNKNTAIVTKTNEALEKADNKKDDGSKLAAYHKKKKGIKDKKEIDIFSYNNTDIGTITACLASAIGSCYSLSLGEIYKIMDLKDCNIQIARQIKSKNDAVSNANKS